MQKPKKRDLVSVRWDKPGSIYHGQVHLVSTALVDYLGGERVCVWWPSRGPKGKRWDGELVEKDDKLDYWKSPSPPPFKNLKLSSSPSPAHSESNEEKGNTAEPPKKRQKKSAKGKEPCPSKQNVKGKKGKAPAKLGGGKPDTLTTQETPTTMDSGDPGPSVPYYQSKSDVPSWATSILEKMDSLEKRFTKLEENVPKPSHELPDDIVSIIDSLESAPSLSPPHTFVTTPRNHYCPPDFHHYNPPYNSPTYFSPPPPSTYSAPPVTPPRPQPLLPNRLSHWPHHPQTAKDPPPLNLATPEKVMAAVWGKDLKSLRNLAVRLARESIFGDDVMSLSSLSGKGGTGQHPLNQLNPKKMAQIKEMVKHRARDKSELEFESIWSKCLCSISKTCQNLNDYHINHHPLILKSLYLSLYFLAQLLLHEFIPSCHLNYCLQYHGFIMNTTK